MCVLNLWSKLVKILIEMINHRGVKFHKSTIITNPHLSISSNFVGPYVMIQIVQYFQRSDEPQCFKFHIFHSQGFLEICKNRKKNLIPLSVFLYFCMPPIHDPNLIVFEIQCFLYRKVLRSQIPSNCTKYQLDPFFLLLINTKEEKGTE